MTDALKALAADLGRLTPVADLGRVARVSGGLVELSGLSHRARIGDAVDIALADGSAMRAEVLQLDGERVVVLPDTEPRTIAIGDRVRLRGAIHFAPGSHWIGRVIDPDGRPIDGQPLQAGVIARDPAHRPAASADRPMLGARLSTGLAVFDTMLPLVEGQRVGLFAGSGVGKSRLLAQLARGMEADVVVLALIGERGREVTDFVHRTLGEEGMARSVVIAATSDRSASLRRRCAQAAMATAEHFRDQGKRVLLLADSITRMAEAHRELAVASREPVALRGHPPSLMPLLTGLAERAGRAADGAGSITAVFTVLVAGSDMEEPVADILRGLLDGHVVLDRAIAERGRFPAVDVVRSVSRSLPEAATQEENEIISETRQLIGAYDRSEAMIRAGLYTAGGDATLDRAVQAWSQLDAFFGRDEPSGVSAAFDRLRLILRRSKATPDRH